MSKYTTEVRYICEQKAGLKESVGANSVDDVISKSWNKIFTTTCEFFDESYRQIICSKILKHYYLREIGAESVGIWKLWMNTRLEEIMPYYNKLYESELLKFNPLYDVDVTRTHSRGQNVKGSKESGYTTTTDGQNEVNTSMDSKQNVINNTTNGSTDLYSDTPQGALSNVENQTYLTNARKIDDTGNATTDTTNKGSTKTQGSSKDVTENSANEVTENQLSENYDEKVTGKQGGSTYSNMLKEYRDTFINIDMQLITEFNDLFMVLW